MIRLLNERGTSSVNGALQLPGYRLCYFDRTYARNIQYESNNRTIKLKTFWVSITSYVHTDRN